MAGIDGHLSFVKTVHMSALMLPTCHVLKIVLHSLSAITGSFVYSSIFPAFTLAYWGRALELP